MNDDRSLPPRSLLLGLTGLEIDGGIASVNRCIARALDHSVARGELDRVDRVLLLSGDEEKRQLPGSGVERRAGGRQWRFVFEMWRSALQFRPDLVLFDHVGLARAGRLALPGMQGCRQAVFVHGEEVRVAGSGRQADALRHADRVLVNSEFTGEVVVAEHPELADRIRVVTLCIDPERVMLWERLGAAAAPAVAREPAAMIVGRMLAEERGKGHDVLLDIWSAVRERVPQAVLWVVGGGDDRQRLERKSRHLGLEGSVHFLGRISDEELHARYQRARVLVMPSRQEGFGLVYAEAMWHGLACIGSREDAARVVIREGETGLLVGYGAADETREAVVRLLSDVELCSRLGSAGELDARERFGFPRFQRDLLAALGLGAR